MTIKKSLNPIETNIFKRLSTGVYYEQIATELNITVAEVERHVNNVFCKLEVQCLKKDIIINPGINLNLN